MKKIIIVDDHKILRDGLKAIFLMNSTIQIVGDTDNEDDLYQLLNEKDTDLILMDIHLVANHGLDIAAKVKKDFPFVKILMHTMSTDEYNLKKSKAIGVEGYVLKSSGQKELEKAIDIIVSGGEYFPEYL